MTFLIKKIIISYSITIRSRLDGRMGGDEQNLIFWQDRLFYNFLVYCFPVSLIALIPGVYMAIQDGFPFIAAVDIICFLLIVGVTFYKSMPVIARKINVISIFYFLSLFLINTLGYLGPGIFYLFFVTVLIALILPIRYAYWSVAFNMVVLLLFAVIIRFQLFHSALIATYTPGKWIAFSSNLVFASIVIVVLIDKIFVSLQLTIADQSQLQERYKSLFDKSPLPMWLFDTETLMFLDVNDAAIKQYGYSKAEFLSMSIRDIRTAAEVREVEEIVKTNKISGAYYDGNSRHIKKNGEVISVKVESNLLNINDRPVRLVLATDITRQLEHQAEVLNYNLKIKESEANLRAIFESALDGFVLLDKDCRIITFNSRALDSIRFNKAQSAFEAGQSIFNYIEIPRVPYFREIINKVYSGETVEYDRRYRDKDGSKVWIRYTLTPVREDDVIIGACIHGRDVTVRKLYLKNLEDQNQTFREISWMQSHMVRAPLARLMGLMPLLKASQSEEERAEIITYLNVSAGELDSIIRQISEKSHSLIQKYPEA